MKAEKCPVCNGSGQYEKRKCHGCRGYGWVTVPDAPVIVPNHWSRWRWEPMPPAESLAS